MLADAQRHALYAAALDTWGEAPADALMAITPPTPWADVARQSDIAGVRGEMAGLRGEMAELRGEMAGLRGEMAELRAEVKGDIAELRGEMAQLRAHVDGQLPKLISANIASMIGVAGLVFAVARVA